MAQCEVPLEPRVHPTLAGRFSPVRFRDDVSLTRAHVDTLLAAAGRAPSAGNSQPWRFVVGLRGGEVHGRIIKHLARSSSPWALGASLVVVNLAQVGVEGAPGWAHSEFAVYDLGQAVAHMSVQGLTMGLDAHQFRAFDRDAVVAEFDVPEHFEVVSMTAFGVADHAPEHFEVVSMTAFGVADHAPDEIPSPGTSRERHGVDDLIWVGDQG